MNAALSAGAGDTAPEAVLLSRKDSPGARTALAVELFLVLGRK